MNDIKPIIEEYLQFKTKILFEVGTDYACKPTLVLKINNNEIIDMYEFSLKIGHYPSIEEQIYHIKNNVDFRGSAIYFIEDNYFIFPIPSKNDYYIYKYIQLTNKIKNQLVEVLEQAINYNKNYDNW